MKSHSIGTLIAVLAIAIGGCSSVPRSPFSYDVRTLNSTTDLLSEVQCRLGDYRSSSGYLSPAAEKTYMYFDHPLASSADVYWMIEATGQYWKSEISEVAWPSTKSKELEGSVLEVAIHKDVTVLSLHLRDKRELKLGQGRNYRIKIDEAPKYWR